MSDEILQKIAADREEKEKQRRQAGLQALYEKRITTARLGKEAFDQKDFMAASKNYLEYLIILAETQGTKDVFALKPNMFDPQKDIAELLLISQIFWELARIYEMAPKLQANFRSSLSSFVKFTIDQPFQVLNAEMLRKYIKKHQKKAPMIAEYQAAHKKIFVESKMCYISTYAYGDDHQVTTSLRNFKRVLEKSSLGIYLIIIYYSLSSRLVNYCKRSRALSKITILILKPLIFLFEKAYSKGSKCF